MRIHTVLSLEIVKIEPCIFVPMVFCFGTTQGNGNSDCDIDDGNVYGKGDGECEADNDFKGVVVGDGSECSRMGKVDTI